MSSPSPNVPLATLRDLRLQKVAKMRDLGLDPYPSQSHRTNYSQEVIENYPALEGTTVTIAGRLTIWRKQGGMAFGKVLDQQGLLQLVLRRDTLAPTDAATGSLGFEDLSLLDVGDIVEGTGTVGRTQRGEISIICSRFGILAKAIRPLPDKWFGLKDRETVLRKRYLDCISNPETKDRFEAISKIAWAARKFLDNSGFREFNTPIIQPQYGGGTAKPFRTHVNALGNEMYLAISHELYLKRLIAAGYEKVYTIGRYFRNEGIDRSHHPEFSMIETMTAYENYEYNMTLVEDLFRYIANDAFGKTTFTVRGHSIDFGKPWERVSMGDLVKRETGIDFWQFTSAEEANGALASLGITDRQETVGEALVRAFEEKVESTLIQPTLVFGHPVEISPLAKPLASDPRVAERFEIFIAGMECGDNWSEQNDPVQLLERWKMAHDEVREAAGTVHPLDFDFVEALEYGMPPTTGIGPGLERMAMIFTEQEDIYDVIFFPMMKRHLSPVNQSIFGIADTDEESAVSQYGPSEMLLTAGEFEDLVRQDVLRPVEKNFEIVPHLRLWERPSFLGRWLANGHLELRGFLPGVSIWIVGYNTVSEEQLSFAEEARKLVELADLSIVSWLKDIFPESQCDVKPVV
jgi:lysyl-tRNA synthetase, class II